MADSDLYDKMEKEHIHYINHKLSFTRGAIAHCEKATAIVVDDKQVKSEVAENTILMQELGHYLPLRRNQKLNEKRPNHCYSIS